MTAWASERIGALCDFDPSKSQVRSLPSETQVSFMRMSDLGIGGQTIAAQETRPFCEVYKGYTYFADGDVLLAKITPCFENGKLGVASGLENGVGFGSSEFMVLRPGPRISAKYLAHYLSQTEFRQLGARAMTGAVGHKRVPKDWVQSIEIPLPPLVEQQRIAAILDKALEEIGAARNASERSLSAVYELEASTLDAQIDIVRSSAPHKALRNICERVTVGHVGTTSPYYCDAGVPFLRTQNVKRDRIDLSSFVQITEEFHNSLAKSQIQAGDVLVSRVVTDVINCGVVPRTLGRANCANVIAIRPGHAVDPEYLALLIRSEKSQQHLLGKRVGSAQQVVNTTVLKDWHVPIPEVDKQREIVDCVEGCASEVRKLAAGYQRKLESLSDLKQSLLARAFSGELTREPLAA